MYLDLPQFTRCCFCLPLRLGVLIWAYFNLAFALLSVGMISYMLASSDKPLQLFVHKGTIFFYTNGVCLLIIALLEVILNIALIVGIHKKNLLIMKIYYYYAISTTLGMAVVNLGIVLFSNLFYLLLDLSMVFAGVGLHGYMILLVRSEMVQLEAAQPHQCVSRLTEIVVSNKPRQDTQSLIVDS